MKRILAAMIITIGLAIGTRVVASKCTPPEGISIGVSCDGRDGAQCTECTDDETNTTIYTCVDDPTLETSGA